MNARHHRVCAALVAALTLACAPAASAAEDLTVLKPGPDGVTPAQRFELWLKSEFHRLVDRRADAFERMIKSAAAARTWQTERRAFFLRQLGALPGRTPLDARVAGVLRGEGYRVEKIVFESRPGFHVTASLYLPDAQPPPWPGVLIPCGHSHDGKAAGQYQRASILLARNGMAALCYDPIGQGERYQMLDRTRQRTAFDDAPHIAVPHPNVRHLCTVEHTMMGLGSILLGANVAQYRVWDGMRVIDYLESRPDILPGKIGCAGNSGGGTETAYLMALDDRIAAAAPGCYLTTFRSLVEGRGPQDAEQNVFAQIAFGMDQADYCIMRVPRPTLICAGTRDVTFDFRGTWELFLDAKRFASRLGHPGSVDINAPDAPHGFTVQQREATARWMSRWLLGRDVEIREVDPLPDTWTDTQLRAYNEPDWTQDQLRCTPEGQVLLMPGERSVFDIQTEAAHALRRSRALQWRALGDDAKRALVRDIIGARAPDATPAADPEVVGTMRRGDCTIHKLALEVEPGLRLPGLVFVPAKPAGVATLYLHGASMATDAAPGGPIDALVRQGRVVLAAELRGIGETETGHDKRDYGRGRFGRDNQEIFLAYLIGRNFVGMRTDDTSAWARALRRFAPAGAPGALDLVALGEAAIPALHAAALAPGEFSAVTLRRMVPSWETMVSAPETFDQAVNVVHGALRHYDLPDLIALVGSAKVTLHDPADAMGGAAEVAP